MTDLRQQAERALLARLARGQTRTRNDLLRKIPAPDGVLEGTWYAALRETLGEMIDTDRVRVREEPVQPKRLYTLR